MQIPTVLYFDHAATTPLRPEARAAMEPFLAERFFNASSLYAGAREGRKAIEEAREKVAASVGARPEDVVFTSGGTEADNLAVKGAAWHGREQGRHRIVVSAIEHHAVLDAARWLARQGFDVREVAVDVHGRVRLDALAEAVDRHTALVAVMWANNEVGTIQPVTECAAIAASAGARFLSDAVQAPAWVPVEASVADFVALSAHKIGGPKGVGALVVRRGVVVQPLLHGGGQERERRSGTYNVAGIAGFGAACEATVAERASAEPRVRDLRDRLQALLVQRLDRVRVNGHPDDRLANNLNLTIDGVESEPLLLLLDAAGVAASSGSACTSGSAEPSHVLLAMGVPRRAALGSLRLTLGPATTAPDVEAVAGRIAEAVARLRRAS